MAEKMEIEATEEMFEDGLYDYQTYTGIDGSETKMPTMGADNGLTLAMMIGKNMMIRHGMIYWIR